MAFYNDFIYQMLHEDDITAVFVLCLCIVLHECVCPMYIVFVIMLIKLVYIRDFFFLSRVNGQVNRDTGQYICRYSIMLT